MLHHLLSFALIVIGFGLLVWHANRRPLERHGGQVIGAPLVTKLASAVVVGVCLFLVPEIAENATQTVIGYALVGLGFAGCLRIITTRIIISDEAISEVSVYRNRRIPWSEVEMVRSSRLDSGFVIVGRYGSKIKIHYLFNGAIQLEKEVTRRTGRR